MEEDLRIHKPFGDDKKRLDSNVSHIIVNPCGIADAALSVFKSLLDQFLQQGWIGRTNDVLYRPTAAKELEGRSGHYSISLGSEAISHDVHPYEVDLIFILNRILFEEWHHLQTISTGWRMKHYQRWLISFLYDLFPC